MSGRGSGEPGAWQGYGAGETGSKIFEGWKVIWRWDPVRWLTEKRQKGYIFFLCWLVRPGNQNQFLLLENAMGTSGTGAQEKEEQPVSWDKNEEGKRTTMHGIAPRVWIPSTSEDEELILAVLSPHKEDWAETCEMGHVHGRGCWGWQKSRKLHECMRAARIWHQEPSPDKEMLFATSKRRQELAASAVCWT